MGAGTSSESLQVSRLTNREAFSAAISSWQSSQAPPGFEAIGGPRRAKVVARKRPLFAPELEHDFDVVACQPDGALAAVWASRCAVRMNGKTLFAEHNAYAVDAAYDETTETVELYAAYVAPLVESAKSGGTACVLMFGQTGSGKTHTMSGFLELAAAEITGPVNVSVIECAKDVYDLVHQRPCVLREDEAGKVHIVAGGEASDMAAADGSSALAVLQAAAQARATAATGVHDGSSRSHCVYSLRFATGGLLMLVDLAGTEWSRDQASHNAARRAETQQINTSLSVLKACLAARETEARAPFREHKLTRLLQDVLSEEAQVLLVATVSPSSADTEHSLDTLSHCCIRVREKAEGVKGQLVVPQSLRGVVAALHSREVAPLPPGVRGWSADDVCEWWLETAEVALRGSSRFAVDLQSNRWPAGQKLGLTLAPGSVTVVKMAPQLAAATPVAQFVRPGCRLVAVGSTEGEDSVVLQALRAAAAEFAASAKAFAELGDEEPAAPVCLRLVFEDTPLPCSIPAVPRIFTGESRRGEGDGAWLVQEFASPEIGSAGHTGPQAFLKECHPVLALHMYSALRARLDREDAEQIVN